jgi:PadR family transcriptional regulator, regulatory protein PadR
MVDGWITQLRKGLIEYCVLLLLRRQESHGYEIVQTLRELDELAVSESTVYPILARLREEKILKARDVPSDAGPPRRCFSLTAMGRVRLAEMNEYWSLLGDAVARLRAGPPKGS